MPLNPIIQSDFSGGMDLFNHDAALPDGSYGIAFNVRNRSVGLDPIKNDIEDEFAPAGLKQGLYAFDKYLVLFNAGLAYYKNVDDDAWTQITSFFMDQFVERVFAQAVPASTANFDRRLQTEDQINGTSADSNVFIQPTIINTTNSGLVVQDGVNQGWIISPLAVATRLNSYNLWTQSNRQYVPIMREMAYINDILFGVSPDRKKIYRSVSGRPIDFVVNVDIHGNKGGDADTVSYSVSYDDITCIQPLNSGELLVATEKSCHPIEFNYNTTIFQEPTFLNRKPFAAGITNQFSFVDILGDYGFIDFDGLRSFNAVSTIQNEGRNSVFSATIADAFKNKKQDVIKSCARVFDNYAIFCVKTKYGFVLAIYDSTRQKWVCFDTISEAIKQFAVADQSNRPTLYGITETKVLKLYSASTFRESSVKFRANCSGRSKEEVKLQNIRAVFDGATSRNVVDATEILDNKVRKVVHESLGSAPTGITYPIVYPITFFNNGTVDNINFNFKRLGGTGWKVASQLKWRNSAKLLLLEVNLEGKDKETPLKQQASLYAKE